MCGQNSNPYRNLVAKLGCLPGVLPKDSHSFCKLRPKGIVQSRMWPEKPHSMLVSNKNYIQQSSDVDSFGLVYAGIYCFAIPAGATRGRMVFDSDLYTKDFHGLLSRTTCTWRVSLSQCLRERIFANPIRYTLKHSSICCIPYVMGGGWDLCSQMSLVNASAVTAPADGK